MAKKNKKGQGPSPTALQTPRQFKRSVRSDVRYAYRPIMQQLGKEQRASRARQRTIGKLYRGQTKLDRSLSRASGKDYANQAKRYTGFLKAVGAQDTAAAQQIQGQQNQISTKYGGAASTEAAQRGQAASAQRGLSAANYGGYSQQLGANSRSYLRKLASAHKHEGIGQRSIEKQRSRQIAQDRRTALRDRADYASKVRDEKRAAERDYLIQQQAFGETKRSNLAGEAISQQNANTSRYSAKTSRMGEKRQRRENRREAQGGGGGGGKGGGKDGRPGSRQDRQRAMSYLRSTAAKGGSAKSPYDSLVDRGVSPAVAKAAVKRWKQKRRNKRDPLYVPSGR